LRTWDLVGLDTVFPPPPPTCIFFSPPFFGFSWLMGHHYVIPSVVFNCGRNRFGHRKMFLYLLRCLPPFGVIFPCDRGGGGRGMVHDGKAILLAANSFYMTGAWPFLSIPNGVFPIFLFPLRVVEVLIQRPPLFGAYSCLEVPPPQASSGLIELFFESTDFFLPPPFSPFPPPKIERHVRIVTYFSPEFLPLAEHPLSSRAVMAPPLIEVPPFSPQFPSLFF